jgi:DNA-binding transcriptional regulator YiaG
MVEEEAVHGATSRVTPMLRYRITAARRAAKLSKAQLARRLGVRARVVADWERGDLWPSPLRMERLARVLHPFFGHVRVWL